MFTTHRKVEAVAPPGGDILDTFTAANGTTIESRPTDSGHIWTNMQGSSAIQDNTAYPATFASTEVIYRIGGLPSEDFTYRVTCHPVNGITGYSVVFYLRIADIDNWMEVTNWVRGDKRVGSLINQKVDGNIYGATSNINLLYGDDPFVMDMVVSGSNLILYFNGTETRNINFDASLTSPSIGIGFTSNNAGTIDYRAIQRIETITP